ncbi:MAG: MFS transporter, partial [Vicinamibacteraceae bacterium]
LGALVYLCYGGGFGTMPAAAGDFFGLRNAGAIYGLMIVGWSIGGIVGPLLVAQLISGTQYTSAFTTIGVMALMAVILPLVTRPRDEPRVAPEASVQPE